MTDEAPPFDPGRDVDLRAVYSGALERSQAIEGRVIPGRRGYQLCFTYYAGADAFCMVMRTMPLGENFRLLRRVEVFDLDRPAPDGLGPLSFFRCDFGS